jgi:hypothetical protein
MVTNVAPSRLQEWLAVVSRLEPRVRVDVLGRGGPLERVSGQMVVTLDRENQHSRVVSVGRREIVGGANWTRWAGVFSAEGPVWTLAVKIATA